MSFPKQTNYAIGFRALVGVVWLSLKREENFSIWKCVRSQSNQS